jgi:hypothetical protein
MFQDTYKTYITLDCLWDTLHGTIRKYNDTIALEILANGYLERRSNILSRYHPKIDDNAIKELWCNRDYDTFKLSLTTNMFNMLAMHGHDNRVLEKDHPYKKQLILYLNTYPYNFNKDFLKVLIKLIKEELKCDKVLRIHIPPYEISNDYIKSMDIHRFITHDLEFFLTNHLSNLDPNKCIPFVRVVAPFSFCKEKAHLENVDKTPIETLCKQIHTTFRAWVDFEILPLQDFSLCPPQNPD